MPSPFPGMDPYLEGPSWMSFHGQLIAEIARQLSPRLRPKYIALMDERVLWDAPDDDVRIDAIESRPDVGVLEYHRSVGVRDVAERRLVCAIEVMSPTNKNGVGYRKYLLKRGRILLSAAHLIEIDLLHHGHRPAGKSNTSRLSAGPGNGRESGCGRFSSPTGCRSSPSHCSNRMPTWSSTCSMP